MCAHCQPTVILCQIHLISASGQLLFGGAVQLLRQTGSAEAPITKLQLEVTKQLEAEVMP